MKISKLDLAKVISDFMFLNEDEPEEKAKVVFKVKHKLTPHGFEKYIQYYFEQIKWYKVKLNWRTNQFDWWIDLKWIKEENWVMKYIVVQCKKHSIKDITENDVSSYFWKTSHTYDKYKNKTESFYITTSKFTSKAKILAEKVWIKTIDFTHIYKMQKIYSVEQFENDIKFLEWEKAYNSSFEKDQYLLWLDEKIYETIWATNNEVFQLLKQVRRDYSHSNQLQLWHIARNDTLELLARVRPHNLESLKETISRLPTRERNKILKHWEVFIERLKYIKEDEIDLNINNSSTKNSKIKNEKIGFFNSLIEFIK